MMNSEELAALYIDLVNFKYIHIENDDLERIKMIDEIAQMVFSASARMRKIEKLNS